MIKKFKAAEDFTPNPINLLESNRSLGYSIEEAVSDLIDNSIAADARNISFNLNWNEGKPYFTLVDDGKGMTKKELIESFKLGSRNPNDERDAKDLGRFGCGMKTASLSQSKAFVVVTKSKNSDLEKRCLDLDYISTQNGAWKLRHVENREIFETDKEINDNGTALIWNSWDKCPRDRVDFNSLSDSIYNYVSVCFHKFLENGIIINCNGASIVPFSPIPKIEDGAQKVSTSKLSNNKKVKLDAYVIQHPSNWKDNYEESINFNSFKLFNGFESQQGIYIYRCDRLLTPNGGWFGILKKSNSAKLARVTIEYSNDADSLWSLDITKTNAKIPYEFVREIKLFVDKTSRGSNEKLNRGRRNVRKNLSEIDGRIWVEKKNNINNSISFKVNTAHKFISSFVEKYSINESEMNSFFDSISECLPVIDIINLNDTDPFSIDRAVKQKELDEINLEKAKIIYDYQISEGKSKQSAFLKLTAIEPFCYYKEQIKDYLKQNSK